MSLSSGAHHPPHIPRRTSSLRTSRWSSCYPSSNLSDNLTTGVALQTHRSTRSAYHFSHSAAPPAPADARAQVQDGRRKPSVRPDAPCLEILPRRSRPKSTSTAMDMMDKRMSLTGAFSSTKGPKPQRWDGIRKSRCEWDELKKDPELWFPEGNCFVHLYEKGHSRRGPSFCVPLEALQKSHCGSLFTMCFARRVSRVEIPLSQLSQLDHPPESMYELYIPAPDDSMREDMFQWHMTTRNFLAFVFKKPLVGTHLGGALVQLQERLHLFRASEDSNYDDFMAYAEELGYLDMANTPDHALAFLYYAEHYSLEYLWTEAYAHCVGMNDVIYQSPEYHYIPRVTKSLITRASLEMDLHLTRVSRTLSNFLEDETSEANLGLPQGARAHLERFRAFLEKFYADKYGYWPPPRKSHFPRALYRSMYYDFHALYDFLVDSESTHSIQFQKPASGGICALQNVQAFDKRHKFPPLPHPMPLLPASPTVASERRLSNFKLGMGKTDRESSTRASLSFATNRGNMEITSSPLVKAYKQFEKDSSVNPKEKVSLSDARKVRWILIYGILQTLVSVTRAPEAVRDTENPEYPLCCLTAGTPPWREVAKPSAFYPVRQSSAGPVADALMVASNKPLPDTPVMDIKPDCEAGDYLTHTCTEHRSDSPSSVDIPAPLRINTNCSTVSPKRGSISRSTSYKAIINRGFSPFSRRNSVQVKPQIQPFCEIQVPGYGNGLNETTIPESPPANTTPLRAPTARAPEPFYNALASHPDCTAMASPKRINAPTHINLPVPTPAAEPKRTPTLEPSQLDSSTPSPPLSAPASPAHRTSSDSSIPWSWNASSRHSAHSHHLSSASSATSVSASAPATPADERKDAHAHAVAIRALEDAIEGFRFGLGGEEAPPSPAISGCSSKLARMGLPVAVAAASMQGQPITQTQTQLQHQFQQPLRRRPSISGLSAYSSSIYTQPSSAGSVAGDEDGDGVDSMLDFGFAPKGGRVYSHDGKARRVMGMAEGACEGGEYRLLVGEMGA